MYPPRWSLALRTRVGSARSIETDPVESSNRKERRKSSPSSSPSRLHATGSRNLFPHARPQKRKMNVREPLLPPSSLPLCLYPWRHTLQPVLSCFLFLSLPFGCHFHTPWPCFFKDEREKERRRRPIHLFHYKKTMIQVSWIRQSHPPTRTHTHTPRGS